MRVQVWPGLGLNTALTPKSGMRSFASAMDGSRMERELSSPYTSSALPAGQVSPATNPQPRESAVWQVVQVSYVICIPLIRRPDRSSG